MKRYFDYEDHEILQMSDEDIDRLIEIECAVAGAPLRMECPTPPVPYEAQPDVSGYLVKAGELRFMTEADAVRCAEFLNGLPRMKQTSLAGNWYGPYRLDREDQELTVNPERSWSSAHYAQHAQQLEAARTAKAEYDAASTEYRGNQKKREDSVRAVRDYRSAINAKDADRRHCRQTFASYLELAENNQDIALGFMLRTAERYDEAFIRETLNFPKETMEQPTEEAREHGTEQEEGRAVAVDRPGEVDPLEF